MGLRDHGSANCLVVAPRRTIVSNEKVVTRFRGQRRRKRISQSCVGSGLETRTSSILGNFNHSSERWSTALAWIQDLHSNPELWDSKQHSWLTSLLLKHNRGLGDKEDSLESWIGNTRGHKVRTWENKLIPALRESPLDVLKILRANLESSRIFLPGSVVEDCLDHLAYFNLNRSTCTSSPYFDMIYSIVGDYLEAYSPILYPISLSQRTIRLISTHCDADQLILFLEKLEKYTAFIHTNTKLHIMPKLVEYGKVGLALSMLKDMPAEDLLLENVQMFCTMLLRAKLGVNDPYRLRSNLLAFMLEAGVRPNRLLANIIILNAAEAGDLSTAWRSHAIAKENGLVPDAGTYTALLKGVHHRNAKLTVRIVYRDAKLDGWLFKSSRLKFELLVAFYISNNGKYNNKPYSDLLPYYQQFFDVKPLYELGILHSTKDCIEENDELPEPEVQTLGLILLAWLTENHGSGLVLAVYERYRYYIQHNHYLIAQLAETDHTANAFIMAFGQSPRTVHRCTQVVQDMLKAQVVRTDALRSSPSTSDVPSTPDISHSNKDGLENVIDDSGREHISNGDLDHHEIRCIAPPSVQTWSIMLFAFIKNGQSSAAEKVLALMEARGQKPNTVTWNSLLSGYAYWQNFPGIIHTLDRMDQAGFGNDEWTTKALARVVDRDALLRSLEESTKVDIDDANGKQAMAFS
ncbi:hypothetical protein MMC15_000422 [Xylographa vitiligo]|nr:hypothetical protein [Xylographa vitiligo]